MLNTDYPDILRASDSASLRAQCYYTNLFAGDILLLIAAAFASLFRSISSGALIQVCGIIAVVALGGSILIKLIMKAKRWDKLWFECRAIAESVKTLTWRYIMGIPPYEFAQQPKIVNETFNREVGQITKGMPGAFAELVAFQSTGERITEGMRNSRVLDFKRRKQLYFECRLKEQLDWYLYKARMNAKFTERGFWIVFALQAGSLGVGIYEIASPNSPIILAVLVSVITGSVAWMEMKRFRDLSYSYGLASDELASVMALWDHVASEDELQLRVVQAEEAISREHTMWCAKRLTV